MEVRLRDVARLALVSARLAWSADRRGLKVALTGQAVLAGGMAAQVLIARRLFTGTADNSSLETLLPWLVATAAIAGCTGLFRVIGSEQTRVTGELVSRAALTRLIDVVAELDLVAFDDAGFHDELTRAEVQAQTRTMQVVQALIGGAGSLMAILTLTAALGILDPLLVPVVVVGYLPLAWLMRSNASDWYLFSFGIAETDRKRMYLQQLLLGKAAAKELRAYNNIPYFRGMFLRLYDQRIADLRLLARRRIRRALWVLSGRSVLTAILVGTFLWILQSGKLTLPVAGATLIGFMQLSGRVTSLHTSLSSLCEASVFVKDFELLTARKADGASLRRPKVLHITPTSTSRFERLELEHIDFAYPNAGRPVIQDVSLEINAGEIVALVGENGSGKTTLAKLIAGLYSESAGTITWNGVDRSSFDRSLFREQISVVFQDFQRYVLTAAQNIGVGLWEFIDSQDLIARAAQTADADGVVAGLRNGYSTVLGNEFYGGQEISIGQWQRLALSRAFFRDAGLLILDEPTSALDPKAEIDLMKRLFRLSEDRGLLLVSHRLSTVKHADRIYVLQHGRVTCEGRHEELIRGSNAYSDLFGTQAGYEAGERRMAVSKD